MLTDILLIAFAGLMVAAAFSDAVRFTIPNWLCGVIAAGFPLVAVAAGLGWADTGLHVLAGFVALVFGFALFAPGWIRMGSNGTSAGSTRPAPRWPRPIPRDGEA